MKANAQMKGRGPSSRANPQQAVFELKQKVVVALNKLADRDTCQIAADELEKMAEYLLPDGISPFLSCILDTDKEQKSAVRKECVRLLGTLATFHEGLVGPHLGKMVASVVKRLKDSDSIVRDACVETMGILASKLGNHGDKGDGVFVVLVKPLFEALGEQNKQVQSGAALCLVRVIDNSGDPPVSILQRMLARTTKLLKNQHFMAKPAVIELNRSIIQAGGAPSHSVLSSAMTSIQEALKNSDWTTRKAASLALADIASSGGSFLGSFKASSIRSLESCRFDKVKPVRDVVLHALQYWKSLPGPDSSEPSETGSCIKENSCGVDYSDLTSTGDSVRKDVRTNKAIADSSKRRIPFSVKRTGQSYVDPQPSEADDWHIEIAVPKTSNVLPVLPYEESEGSSVTKSFERMSAEIASTVDTGCEYVPMDDKQDSCSLSTAAADSFETRFMATSPDSLEESGLPKQAGKNNQFPRGGTAQVQVSRSLDSTVTETGFQTMYGCCQEVAGEMACIRKQLLEIENKQSNLMELLQVFSTGIMESFSSLQSKVSSLEHEVDRIRHLILQGERHSGSTTSRLMKQNQTISSPRVSMYTPRPSVDVLNRQPSLLSAKNSDIWEDRTYGRSRSIITAKQDTDMWTNSTTKTSRSALGKDMPKNAVQGFNGIGQARKRDSVRQTAAESKNSLWQRVKGFLCKGDLESAYVEALCSQDELVLIELLERTGPVLENLSHKTGSDILSTLASYFLEQRFTNSIIPWLQQVVELSTIHGPDYLVLSAKARREFLSAIKDAVNSEFSSPVERGSITQLAIKLSKLWGKSF